MTGKVTVQSDGFDVAVVDGDGNKIDNVISATIRIDRHEVTRVDLTIIAPSVNASGEVDTITVEMPCCGTQIDHDCRSLRKQ